MVKQITKEAKKLKKTEDTITEAFLKTKAAEHLVQDVVDKIKRQGGPPSETTSEKVYTKAIKEVRKIIGGGAELRGGGRAVMKKGGKV
jgi:molecular chaperone DnaK (HSP70)